MVRISLEISNPLCPFSNRGEWGSFYTSVSWTCSNKKMLSEQADPVGALQAAEERPSAALPSFLIVAAYFTVRLTLRNFGCLASGRF
jgi:hypothetical protein